MHGMDISLRYFQTPNNSETAYLDQLAVLSCMAVVFLHFNGIFWARPTGSIWIISNIIETAFYFAVPIFFMISGCNLIDYRKKYSTKDFAKKRLKRTVVPFLIWSIFGFLFYCLQQKVLITSPREIIMGIVSTKFTPIYWFFPAIFALYLSFPILGLIENKIRSFSYMIIYAFLTISIASVLHSHGINIPIKTPISAGFLIYPLLGYVLHRINLSPMHRRILYIVGILCVFIHFYVTTFSYNANGTPDFSMKGYERFPAVIQACALFVFFKYNHFSRTSFANKLIIFTKPTTLSIYLTHIYIYTIIKRFTHGIVAQSPMLYLPAALVTFVALAIIIRFLQKVPYIRCIFP